MCLQWFPLSSPWRVTCRMHTTNARLSPDHVSLEGGVALRRVDDNDVDMFRRQRLNALVIALTSPDCSSCILTMVRPRDVHTPATSRHSVVRLRELTQSKLEASQSRASLRLRKQSSQRPRTAKELFRCLVFWNSRSWKYQFMQTQVRRQTKTQKYGQDATDCICHIILMLRLFPQ